MSADPTPHGKLAARPLYWLTWVVVRMPISTVVIGAAVAVAGLAFAATRLEFRTSRLDLLNPKSAYNKLWLEYIDEFGDDDDVLVVVEGDDPAAVITAIEALTESFAADDHLFRLVLSSVDLSRFERKGLYYAQPDELRGIDRFLDGVEPIVRGNWSQLSVSTMLDGACHQLQAAGDPPPANAQRAAAVEQVARLAASLRAALGTEPHYVSPWPPIAADQHAPGGGRKQYLLDDDGRRGLILLQLADRAGGFARGEAPIAALRERVDRFAARHPQLRVGATGLPIMEFDEMHASQTASAQASILSLVGVAVLFMAAFGGLRHPLLTVAALLLGIAWSVGYLTLAVGHLNILSVSFGVILIGLGIDFGLHYTARYLQLRPDAENSLQALEQTAVSVGPGIAAGAVTTAIAFFAAGLTEFTGVAELGVIAGGGVLLCAVAALVVLPAILQLADSCRSDDTLPSPLRIDRAVAFWSNRPRVTLFASVVFTAILCVGIPRVWYDHNLLNLQPVGLESVDLERRLLSDGDRSVWFALSVADSPRALLARKEQFLALDTVDRTEEIVSLLPADAETKRPLVERIASRTSQLPQRAPRIPVDSPANVAALLDRAAQLVGGSGRATPLADNLQDIRRAALSMPLAICYERVAALQQQMAGDLLRRLATLAAMSDTAPPQLDDLPESVRRRFVGRSGKHLLKVYAAGNIWDMQALGRFVRDVRSVDPRATGNPLQTYEASLQMKESYERAAVYSLVAIVGVLYLDFGRLRHALLAMLPLAFGAVQMFGVLGLLNIPLNPANVIVLPLILGIGIDDGVHVVHDYLQQQGRYRISRSTATSVLLTSLTTMIGFGSLMIASHRGLQSLGRVLVIGVSCCLLSSAVLLPAVLSWLSAGRKPQLQSSPSTPIPAAPLVPHFTRIAGEPAGIELSEHGGASSA